LLDVTQSSESCVLAVMVSRIINSDPFKLTLCDICNLQENAI